MKKPGPGCDAVKEKVSMFLDGELCREEAGKLLERIRNCAEEGCRECVELMEDLKKLREACRCPEAGCFVPPEVRENLKARLMRIMSGGHGGAGA
ncbi:MAG: hypothetical protein JW909_12380 [Planctomycetes bacterium]|nr:hypothetical protein [Planctomycetota bacterium]